ncbi:MAG: hypothetical protein OH344_02395 [Candidatus Parvarchaeota archaeon]|nr:hypothetical protein [Candidatus Jingweiarchaeum tengchongense]
MEPKNPAKKAEGSGGTLSQSCSSAPVMELGNSDSGLAVKVSQMKEARLFNLYANYSFGKLIERHDFWHFEDNCETCGKTFSNEQEFLKHHENLGFTFYDRTPFGYYLFTRISEQELQELQRKFDREVEEARRQKEEMRKKRLQELKNKINKIKAREEFIFKVFGGGGTRYDGIKVWINAALVDRLVYIDEEKVEVKVKSPPWEGVKIIKTAKGSLVAVPDKNFVVVEIMAPKKFRGHSYIKVLDKLETFEYWVFESPRGRVGTQKNVLVNVPNTVNTIRLEINGTEYIYNVETGERSEVPPEEVL